MKCLQATKLISESQERKLNFTEKVGVKTHLMFCPHCRNFKLHCEQMSKLMKNFANNS
ncbi:dsDNA-mimic protein [Pasteurellaceae bacterium Pebbles2]|nr:dsDNA-mimic protein [Pasteurellaceae bacterium Pebbles2]